MYFIPSYYSSEAAEPQVLLLSPVSHTETYHIINVTENQPVQTQNVEIQRQAGSTDKELAQRFNTLRTLTDGWYDGRGAALNDSQLDLIAARMNEGYPRHLPIPAIVPTPEGNLLLEWNVSGMPSVDLRLSDMKAEFHAFRVGANDLEQEFDLSAAEEWPNFFAFLTKAVGSATQ